MVEPEEALMETKAEAGGSEAEVERRAEELEATED